MTDIFDPMETAPATSDQKARPNIASAELRSFLQRIERLEEEKATIAEDIKQVYGEAKGFGLDTKILRKMVAIRKRDEVEVKEEYMLLDTYFSSIGSEGIFG